MVREKKISEADLVSQECCAGKIFRPMNYSKILFIVLYTKFDELKIRKVYF